MANHRIQADARDAAHHVLAQQRDQFYKASWEYRDEVQAEIAERMGEEADVEASRVSSRCCLEGIKFEEGAKSN